MIVAYRRCAASQCAPPEAAYNLSAMKTDRTPSLKLATIAACIAAASLFSSAQKPQDASSASPFKWDAVSIKPHRALDNSAMTQTLADGFEMQNMTIHSLAIQAFPVRSGDQIVGWPAWTNSEHFDFRAKMDAETADAFHKLRGNETADMWHVMIRQILVDRFSLKYHMEKRELPVYELVLAKHGPKMKTADPGEPSSSMMSPGKLSAQQTTTAALAGIISGIVGRQVNDKTSLTGVYDIDLTWAWNDDPASGDTSPSIFTALQDQLGLKLQSAKAPVDVVVIDQLERPSEN